MTTKRRKVRIVIAPTGTNFAHVGIIRDARYRTRLYTTDPFAHVTPCIEECISVAEQRNYDVVEVDGG